MLACMPPRKPCMCANWHCPQPQRNAKTPQKAQGTNKTVQSSTSCARAAHLALPHTAAHDGAHGLQAQAALLVLALGLDGRQIADGVRQVAGDDGDLQE